jgi:hypothetical protein
VNVTISYNIVMTFAVVGYAFLMSPFWSSTSGPTIIADWLPENWLGQFLVTVVAGVLGIVASMYIVRSLWNRLFPRLCGWREVNLAEAYALSLLGSMFLI